jgi:hypothetical protein
MIDRKLLLGKENSSNQVRLQKYMSSKKKLGKVPLVRYTKPFIEILENKELLSLYTRKS